MDIKYKFPKMNIDMEKYNKYDFKTQDKQLSKLPEKVIYCKKCLMSNQRQRTDFDEEGVCSTCRYAEKKFHGGIDWDTREKELKELLDKHRSKDGSFDCLVPSSGGKDSGLVAHQLKHKYGMHPLLITWAPFVYSDIGFQNYYNHVQAGFNGLVAWPNGFLHRKLARISFELKGDNFDPFVYGQKSFAFHVALRFKIPLIFYGENGEVEYGGSMKNAEKPYESVEDWEELYFKGAGVDVLIKEGLKMGIFTEEEIKNNDFSFYRPPPLEEIKKLGIQMHWWSYYKLWVPQENVYYCAKNTGFEASPVRTDCTYTKAFSVDDKLDPFHFWLALIKFGYGRASREASSDIRCGHISREEGVMLAKKYDDEFPKTYFKEFLDYMDITEEYFWEVIDRYRRPEVWKKVNGEWKRRHTVARDGVDD
ncbi:MAG: N-acetyl sugar amidotransferase [Candidatus Nanoarchaeia archaeon]|nr:N-acetyl sugar amidotransferase [Candidatus Nanoarchaeia archaeon]